MTTVNERIKLVERICDTVALRVIGRRISGDASFLSAARTFVGQNPNENEDNLINRCLATLFVRKTSLSNTPDKVLCIVKKKPYSADIKHWLEGLGMKREEFHNHAQESPLQAFVDNSHDENTRKRLLNNEMGFMLCKTHTLGWNPTSPSCRSCKFSSPCQNWTASEIPVIYHLRKEILL